MKRIAIRGGSIIGSFDLASCHNGRDRLERHLKITSSSQGLIKCHNNIDAKIMLSIWSFVRSYDFRFKTVYLL